MGTESILSNTRTLRRSLFRLRSLRRDRRGVTAVEFAIIAPVMIGMCISVVDFGLGLYTQVQVADAAQAGAAYAMQKGYNSTAMATVAKASTKLTGLTVATSQFCGCPSATGVTTTSCTASCGDGLTAGTFAQISVAKAYSTLLSYPGLPTTINMSESAVARTQ
jgi:Flp pilus assembly protein TadG